MDLLQHHFVLVSLESPMRNLRLKNHRRV